MKIAMKTSMKKSDSGRSVCIVTGFTLLELLVALAVFSVLAAISYGGLNKILTGSAHSSQQMDRLAELQRAFVRVGRDLEQAVVRPVRSEYGDSMPAFAGKGLEYKQTELLFELTRNGWRNPLGRERSHLQRIAYGIKDNKLIRFRWAVLDRAQDSEPTESELLTDIKSIKVRFLDQQNLWQPEWPLDNPNGPPTGSPSATGDELSQPQIPRAVELTIDVEGWGKIRRLYKLPG